MVQRCGEQYLSRAVRSLFEATDVAVGLLRHEARDEEVGEAVLEQLARAVRCEWGVYWGANASSAKLCAKAIWCDLGEQGRGFDEGSRLRALALGNANVLRVWSSRKPLLAHDLTLGMGSRRCLPASQAGLRAGVWFGVQTEAGVYGVVELMARSLPRSSKEALVAFQLAGLRLGYALEELGRT